MADTAQLSDWRKCRQESLGALPGHAVFFTALLCVLLCLDWWIGLSFWIWIVAVGIGASRCPGARNVNAGVRYRAACGIGDCAAYSHRAVRGDDI